MYQVVELDGRSCKTVLGPNTALEGESWEDNKLVLYKKGKNANFFSLLLQGHFFMKVGNEEITSEMGPWSCIGAGALEGECYSPDFTVVCSRPCRLLRINRKDYQKALMWTKVIQTMYTGFLCRQQTTHFREHKSSQTTNERIETNNQPLFPRPD